MLVLNNRSRRENEIKVLKTLSCGGGMALHLTFSRSPGGKALVAAQREYVLFTTEKAMAPHSSTLAWKIPWTEEPGRLQSMGSLRVGLD